MPAAPGRVSIGTMSIRFTLRQLEYLVAVGEAGSIARAAGRVNVSAPSISAAIAQLEREFGVQLFVRKHSHGLSLTAGGRRFVDTARHLLAEAEALNDIAAEISERVRGPLAVGCLRTFAHLVLPELRRGFEARWPEVSVRQVEGDQAVLLDLLRQGGIDVALTYDLELSQDIAFQPLLSLPPYVMLPAGHPLAAEPAIEPEALAAEPMVLLDLPYSRNYFLSIFQRRGLRPQIAERTGDMAVMRSMVANGYGYALANVRPRTALAPDGKPLAFVKLAAEDSTLQMGLASPRSERKTRTVRAFEAHCRALARSGTMPGIDPPDR